MKKTVVAVVVAAIIIPAVLISCGKDEVASKPIVVSTVGMVDDLVHNIAKDKVTRIGLMGPGVDPHLYKASAGDVKSLQKADLIFYVGLDLEAKLVDVFETLAK